MKFIFALSFLLLTGCAKTEGLKTVPTGGFLPGDVPAEALTEVIAYENLNKYGSAISQIVVAENKTDSIKLRVVAGDAESLFSLKPNGGSWQIASVQ